MQVTLQFLVRSGYETKIFFISLCLFFSLKGAETEPLLDQISTSYKTGDSTVIEIGSGELTSFPPINEGEGGDGTSPSQIPSYEDAVENDVEQQTRRVYTSSRDNYCCIQCCSSVFCISLILGTLLISKWCCQ